MIGIESFSRYARLTTHAASRYIPIVTTDGKDIALDPISAKQAEVDRLRRQLDIAEAEMRGMLAMRDYAGAFRQPTAAQRLPASSVSGSKSGQKLASATGGYRGGRQPGAISAVWRLILSDLYWIESPLFDGPGVPFSVDDIVVAARMRGINLRPSEAVGRMSHYKSFNYVSESEGGNFAVTGAAAEKFGFDKEPLKNEAPNAEASGPHESVGPADQTGAG